MSETKSTNKELIEVQKLIEAGQLDLALRTLVSAESKSAEQIALQGLVYFLKEEYNLATEKYTEALQLNAEHPEWNQMKTKAVSNTLAEVHEFVPEKIFFEKKNLLAASIITEKDLPVPNIQKFKIGNWRITRALLGNGVGILLTLILELITLIWGKIVGYQDEIWTNWYRKPVFFGILSLAYMRDRLNHNNLKTVYPDNTLVGFQYKDLKPPNGVSHFRTADGSWNNLKDPKEGAAGTRFTRNVTAAAVQQELSNDLLYPNPRIVSSVLLTRKAGILEAPFINVLAAAWVQFQTHDWVSHGETVVREMIEIPLPENDPARKNYHQTKIFVGRTQQDPTRTSNEVMPLTFNNEVTHWWDGSQIYGSDQITQSALRSGSNGMMKMNEDGTLPLDKKGIEITGYVRNWWVGLSLFHTLFVKEHNAICALLINEHSDWDDNRLFQTARLINTALMAKIHTIEWNSAINPNKSIYNGNHTNWYGYLTTLRKKSNWKTVADINVRNTELGGVVGNPVNKHGCPFGLTQEFVEAYRLHPLLPEELRIIDKSREIKSTIPLPSSRQAGSAKLIEKHGLEDLYHSLGAQNGGQFVLNNYPKFMQELSIPGNPLYDLGAVDVLRTRERGVPRYNEFRRQLGLIPLKSFEELTSNADHRKKLRQVYGDDPDAIEKLDMMIGTLAEDKRPTGFALGETQFQLFLLNATRRLQTDRFYTDCYTEAYYTQEGMKWIDNNTLKSVLLRHYPDLATTGLGNINNAFEPWDNERILDPKRHPIRAFDPDTKKDPWTGERYKTK